MQCPSAETANHFVEGKLADEAAAAFEEHIDRCSSCRELMARLAQAAFVEDATDSDEKKGPTRERPRPGQIISSRYQVVAMVGGGGMGEVYRAVDQRLGRTVALKFLNLDKHDDAQARARFLREAQAASALDHANIGTIYNLEEWREQGMPFIVMALYEGANLRDHLRQKGRLTVDESLAILRQLAAALGAAHRVGIVHRDLKPANVMLTREGPVKLLDFGLAKLVQGKHHRSITLSGAIVGTLGYMSPEQLRGDPVDARTDMWALGALLQEMLSGSPPFGRGTLAVMASRVLKEPPAPLPDDLPAVLPPLVASLLCKSADERLASTELLLARLDGNGRELRRRRWPLLAAGGVAACAAGLAWALWPNTVTITPLPATTLTAAAPAKAATSPALVPALAAIRIATTAENPRWQLDGAPLASGGTTLSLDGIAPGKHSVRVDADGYLGRDASFTVAAGQTLELGLPLERAPIVAGKPLGTASGQAPRLAPLGSPAEAAVTPPRSSRRHSQTKAAAWPPVE